MPTIPQFLQRKSPATSRYQLTAGPGQLGDIYPRDFDKEPAPIVSLAIGSAGIQRSALWYHKMRALGCAGRIQSMVLYDCNATNIQEWNIAAESAGISQLCITPEYLPLSEGFLRQPNFFIDHFGAIERDIERAVDDTEKIANEAGIRPQVIIEWLGFGGHARLSSLIHEQFAERFTGAKFLPIYCIPAERVLEENIREHQLWEETEKIIGAVASVITDNRAAGSLQILDERIAIALASVEAAYRFRPEVGTLAEVVSSFNIGGNRWLRLDTSELAYRAGQPQKAKASRRAQREGRMIKSAVVQSIKEAIWRLAEPDNDENHTGFFPPANHTAEQRIYCLLPFTPSVTADIKDDVEDQLTRETFTGPYASTKICFAPGNALWSNHDQFAYAHLSKFTGLPPEPIPTSIARVLNADQNVRTSRRRILSRGEAMMQQLGMELFPKGSSTNGSSGKSPRHMPEPSQLPGEPPTERPKFRPGNLAQSPAPLLEQHQITVPPE